MNEVKSVIATEIKNSATATNVVQATYVKPAIEVIELEVEEAILNGSGSGTGGGSRRGNSGAKDFGNGGYYERL